ncbi:hypothetical protein BCR36DRAFT_245052, partial [Piromyces finnis]
NKKEGESTGQSKKKKKSKKKNDDIKKKNDEEKNDDIELHILKVKNGETQLMKETQLYRLPLTAIAKKLIPEDSGTTLGLKPIFPPDIEIEALCNVIVKRSKKKKRDNIDLPYFKSKIGQLNSNSEDDKIDLDYIDDVEENIILEGNEEHTKLMKQKQMEILKNHKMEVNMITSLKQIKRRNLNNITNGVNNKSNNTISINNKNNVINEIEIITDDHSEGDNIIEHLTDEFLDEEDIQEIKEGLGLEPDDIIELKMTNNILEHQEFVDRLNEKMIDTQKTEESNSENQFFVLQALDALINTAEVYASALRKQIEEYENKDENEEENESDTDSINYNRKVKIYEAVLESIKDIREMGLSDYKTIEKLYLSDPKGEENYEDNINNLLISVKYIMQELVLNVDEPDILPQVLSLNKNTNILLSKMKGDKFKDTVLKHYKKLFKEKYGNIDSSYIHNHVLTSPNVNVKKSLICPPTIETNHKNKHEAILPPLPSPPKNSVPIIAKTNNGITTSTFDKIPEIIEPENLKKVNKNIQRFLKDYKMDESKKIIKIKKATNEKPSSSNIELKIEYENEEVKNRVEKISKTESELYNSTEDILLELILKSQENQELKTKLISNCLNFDVNLAKKLANSIKIKEKEKEK